MKNQLTKILVLLYVIAMPALPGNDDPLPVISTIVFINPGNAAIEFISNGITSKNCICPEGKISNTISPAYINETTFLSFNICSKIPATSGRSFKNTDTHNICNPYSRFKPWNSKMHYTWNLNTGFENKHSLMDKRKALPVNEKSNIEILS